jgi:ABC-type sugar transport system permease subunit
MRELDIRIREALRSEDAELFPDFGEEPGVFEMLLETFRGRHRWLNMVGAACTLVFLAIGLGSAVAFFRADETRDLVMWAAICVMCVSAVAMLKVWYWLELQRLVVTREIKRVELQIARLAARIPTKEGPG